MYSRWSRTPHRTRRAQKSPNSPRRKWSPLQRNAFLFFPVQKKETSWESLHRSIANEITPGSRSDPPIRVRTRDEIYELYCTFGEKEPSGGDFLSRIMNILRNSTEGLLSHAEVNDSINLYSLVSLFCPIDPSCIIKRRAFVRSRGHKHCAKNSRNMLESWSRNWRTTSSNASLITNNPSMVRDRSLLIDWHRTFCSF